MITLRPSTFTSPRQIEQAAFSGQPSLQWQNTPIPPQRKTNTKISGQGLGALWSVHRCTAKMDGSSYLLRKYAGPCFLSGLYKQGCSSVLWQRRRKWFRIQETHRQGGQKIKGKKREGVSGKRRKRERERKERPRNTTGHLSSVLLMLSLHSLHVETACPTLCTTECEGERIVACNSEGVWAGGLKFDQINAATAAPLKGGGEEWHRALQLKKPTGVHSPVCNKKVVWSSFHKSKYGKHPTSEVWNYEVDRHVQYWSRAQKIVGLPWHCCSFSSRNPIRMWLIMRLRGRPAGGGGWGCREQSSPTVLKHTLQIWADSALSTVWMTWCSVWGLH